MKVSTLQACKILLWYNLRQKWLPQYTKFNHKPYYVYLFGDKQLFPLLMRQFPRRKKNPTSSPMCVYTYAFTQHQTVFTLFTILRRFPSRQDFDNDEITGWHITIRQTRHKITRRGAYFNCKRFPTRALSCLPAWARRRVFIFLSFAVTVRARDRGSSSSAADKYAP